MGVTAGNQVAYSYTVDRHSYEGAYSDAQGGNRGAALVKVGDHVYVEYARGRRVTPADATHGRSWYTTAFLILGSSLSPSRP